MSDRWTDLISEYLDGCMEPAARRDMEAHLQACAECSATLEDLRGIVAPASSLPVSQPAPEIWSGIEARLRASAAAPASSQPARARAPQARVAPWSSWRVSFSLPQLAAACVAVIALSGGLAYF